MSLRVADLPDTEIDNSAQADAGLGVLSTQSGNLPLRGLDIACHVTGLTVRTVVTQRFGNPHPEPIEATYIFPLPERAAVTDMTMTVADRTVTAELRERGEAREAYSQAIQAGKRAAIAEAERADVFTMRVGNILAGEEAIVTLTLVGPLTYEDGDATLRMPLVVAPRYIPGAPIGEVAAGEGYAEDTDAVPDASRITPPVLLPGFPNPVALSVKATIDSAGLRLANLRSSLHAVATEETEGRTTVTINPGERVNRDFILRFGYGSDEQITSTVVTVPDQDDPSAGVFQLTALPPRIGPTARARDVVVLLDRSGSMQGWKMVAARRAAARIVDTLSSGDRFAVRCFDHQITVPEGLGDGLVDGTDRNRYRAVEHLSRADARGGTELLQPLLAATELLDTEKSDGRDRIVVLVTDGQVGNEDQILAQLEGRLSGVRVHVVGIDRAVNGGFLYRLALAGRGRCELVESEDRLDEATAYIHRRIVAPVVTDLAVTADSGTVTEGSLAPARLSDLFTGVPLVIFGRYTGDTPTLRLAGTDVDGNPWSVAPTATVVEDDAVRAAWARAHLRDLEDRYAAASRSVNLDALEKQIVATSVDNRVLSKFTAFVAIDARVVTEEGRPRKVVQPVEMPDGWDMKMPFAGGGAQPRMAMMAAQPVPPPAPGALPPPAFGTADMQGYGGVPQAEAFGSPSPAQPFAAAPPIQPFAAPAAPGGGRMLGRPRAAVRRTGSTGGTAPQEFRAILAQELALLVPEVQTMQWRPQTVVDRERRMQLSDLGSRLDAVSQTLTEAVLPEAEQRRLRDLVTALARCEGPKPPTGQDLEDLWQLTISTLTSLVDSAVEPSEAATPPKEPPARGGAFWKRRA